MKNNLINAILSSSLVLAGTQAPAAPQTDQPAVTEADDARCTAAHFAAPGTTITDARIVRDGYGARCRVRGTVVTAGYGIPTGVAEFALELPQDWNGRFLFVGYGGYGGQLSKADPAIIKRGYAIVTTNGGHSVSPSADDLSWARLPNGDRNAATVADFQYRAPRSVNAAIRPLVQRYYGRAPAHSIFMGCSGGGRLTMLEAQDDTDAYDGYIALSPAFETTSSFSRLAAVKAFMTAPIARAKLDAVAAEFTAQCDAADGMHDNLVQSPAACNFDPKRLASKGILTAAEAGALTRYMSPLRDPSGKIVALGYPVSDLAFQGGYAGGGASTYIPQRSLVPGLDPARDASAMASGWRLGQPPTASLIFNRPDMDVLGPDVFVRDGVVTRQSTTLARKYMGPDIPDPSQMGRFFASGKKLIIVHGWADPLLTPYATIKAYRTMVRVAGSQAAAEKSMRLFMVPEMQHCGGGSGPNVLDSLAAMDDWLTKGTAPESIIATKYLGDDPRAPISRTMPVCVYPRRAVYTGRGDPLQGANWSCSRGNEDAKIGLVGRLGGL